MIVTLWIKTIWVRSVCVGIWWGYGCVLIYPLPMQLWHWTCFSSPPSKSGWTVMDCGGQDGFRTAGGRGPWGIRSGWSFWGWSAKTAPRDTSWAWLSLCYPCLFSSEGPRHWPIFSLVTVFVVVVVYWREFLPLVYKWISYQSLLFLN